MEAEIANIQAQTDKARADAAKIEADSRAAQKSWRDWSLEAVKVVSAIALGLGGITAAITGYQISEVRKEKLDLESIKTKAQLDELNSQKASTDAAVNMAQPQLAAMKKEVEGLQGSLETAKKSGNSGKLDEAISQAARIGRAVLATNDRLRSAEQFAPRSRQISDYIVGVQTFGVPACIGSSSNFPNSSRQCRPTVPQQLGGAAMWVGLAGAEAGSPQMCGIGFHAQERLIRFLPAMKRIVAKRYSLLMTKHSYYGAIQVEDHSRTRIRQMGHELQQSIIHTPHLGGE